MPENHLIIFIKAPRPGLVKTRLAQVIGNEAACEAYQALVETLLFNLRETPHGELKFTPADACDEVSAWLPANWDASPQIDGELGERLIAVFQEAFMAGARRVVVIGSDCPYVTRPDCENAFAALEEHDVVLGPATDGGYWLVGLRSPQRTLFEEINWSTETVLQETMAVARREHLSVKQLRELSDVDTVADLARFHDWHTREVSR